MPAFPFSRLGNRQHYGMGRASRRNKKKRSVKSQAVKFGPWGFDYGVSVQAAAVGSVNFSQKLTEANVIAVAYGSMYADEVHGMIPVLLSSGGTNPRFRKLLKSSMLGQMLLTVTR